MKKGVLLTVLFLLIGITIIPNIKGFTYDNFNGENKKLNKPIHNGFNITVEIDQYYFFSGETVNIHGKLTKNGTGFSGKIDFVLLNPHGNNVFGGMMHTNSDGSFNITYTIDKTVVLGVYNFTVYYENIPTVRATTSFQVNPRLQIENVRGGLGKIHTKITNLYGTDLQNVSWSIFLVPNGGFFTFDEYQTNGTISVLKANETASIETSGFLLGLGLFELFITAKISGEERNKVGNGVIFFFILICKA